MRRSVSPQSATSLPRAPRDDAHARMTKYFVMMSVRVACFVLTVVVTPYGWYTWLFAAGAAFLPYVAVVVANVASQGRPVDAMSPDRALTGPPPADAGPAPPRVIQVNETRELPGDTDGATPARGVQ
ncbi:DUF3099 domain-containing protein [Microbacterium sp.]|uniref:DUF3099 domain-containing protein n=1 Tax=Microbacterium sp. TaxID=51671 RepID=UPI003A8A1F8F